MSCDVDQYLPQGDSPDFEVERIVHSPMRIVRDLQTSGRRRSRRSLRPKEIFELQLESDNGNVILLRAYRRKGGDLMAELHNQSIKMRALHTHEGHRNPGCRHSLPDGHMHFPSVAFPLAEGKSSYAYELDCSNDEHLVNFIDQFCAIFDIQLGPFQLTLNSTRYQ